MLIIISRQCYFDYFYYGLLLMHELIHLWKCVCCFELATNVGVDPNVIRYELVNESLSIANQMSRSYFAIWFLLTITLSNYTNLDGFIHTLQNDNYI